MHFNFYQRTWLEYFAPNGEAHIWYAGRTGRGQWRLEEYEEAIGNQVRRRARICLLYPPGDQVPYDHQKGGVWWCSYPESYAQLQVDGAAGDPVRLQAGAPGLAGYRGDRATIALLAALSGPQTRPPLLPPSALGIPVSSDHSSTPRRR